MPLAATNEDWLDLFQAQLGGYVLGAPERRALENACVGVQTYSRRACVSDEPTIKDEPLHLVIRGWAARVCMLKDGAQQITDIFLPGELCDLPRLNGGSSGRVIALTPLSLAVLDRQAVVRAAEKRPKLALAFLHVASSEQAVLREWLVCLGTREKREHVAHLLCELHQRLSRLGMVTDHGFDLPLTQEQLAETTGMTPVHANRILQRLRKDGVISLEERHLRIIEPLRLKDIGEFDGSYLGASPVV